MKKVRINVQQYFHFLNLCLCLKSNACLPLLIIRSANQNERFLHARETSFLHHYGEMCGLSLPPAAAVLCATIDRTLKPAL